MPKIRRKRNNFSVTNNTVAATSSTANIIMDAMTLYESSSVSKIKDGLINFNNGYPITNINNAALFQIENTNNQFFLFGLQANDNNTVNPGIGNLQPTNTTKTIDNRSSSNVEYSNATYYSIGIKDEHDWVLNNLTSSSSISSTYSGGTTELNGLLLTNFYLPVVNKIKNVLNNLNSTNNNFLINVSINSQQNIITLTQQQQGTAGNKSIVFFNSGENMLPRWLSIASFINGGNEIINRTFNYQSSAMKSGVVSKSIKKTIKEKSYFYGSLPFVKNITGDKLENTNQYFNDDKTINFKSESNNGNYITGKSVTVSNNKYKYFSLPEYDSNNDGLEDTNNSIFLKDTEIFSEPNELYGIEDFNFNKELKPRDLKNVIKQERFSPESYSPYIENSAILTSNDSDFFNKNLYENKDYDIKKRKQINIEVNFENDAELKFNKYTKFTTDNTTPTTTTFNPNNTTSFSFTKGLSSNVNISSDYTPTAYFNFVKNRWDYLYYNDEDLTNETLPVFSNSGNTYTLKDKDTNEIIGNLPICFTPGYFSSTDDVSNTNNISVPTTSYGFPQKGNWQPLEDHYLKMSDYIDEDFILEKIVIEGFGSSYGEPTEYNNDTTGLISNSFNFFILNQRNNFNLSLRDRCLSEEYDYNFVYDNKYTQNSTENITNVSYDHLHLTVDGINPSAYDDLGEPLFEYQTSKSENTFKTKNLQNNNIFVTSQIKDNSVRELIAFSNMSIWNKYQDNYSQRWDTILNNFDSNVEIQQVSGINNSHLNKENFEFRIESNLKSMNQKNYDEVKSKYSFYLDIEANTGISTCPSSLISIKEGKIKGNRNLFNLNTSDRDFDKKSYSNSNITNSTYVLKPEDNIIFGVNSYANGNLLSTVFKLHKKLRVSLIGRTVSKKILGSYESYSIRRPLEDNFRKSISQENFRLIKDTYIDSVFEKNLETEKSKDYKYYEYYFNRNLINRISSGKSKTFTNTVPLFEDQEEKTRFISDSVLASPYKVHLSQNNTIRDTISNSNISPANFDLDNKLILGSDFSKSSQSFTEGVVSNSWQDGSNPSWINNKWYYTFPFETQALSNIQNNQKSFFDSAENYGINGFAIDDNNFKKYYYSVSTPDNVYKKSDVIKETFDIEKTNNVYAIPTKNNHQMYTFGTYNTLYAWKKGKTYKNVKGYVYTPGSNDATLGINISSLRQVEVYADIKIPSSITTNNTLLGYSIFYEENIPAAIEKIKIHNSEEISNGDILVFFEPHAFKSRKFIYNSLLPYISGPAQFYVMDPATSVYKSDLFIVPYLKIKYEEDLSSYDYVNFPLYNPAVNNVALWNNETIFKFNDGRSVTSNNNTFNLENFSKKQKYSGNNISSASVNLLKSLSLYNLESSVLSDFTDYEKRTIDNNELLYFSFVKKIFYSFNSSKNEFPVLNNEGFKYGVYNYKPTSIKHNFSWNSWGNFSDRFNNSKNYATYTSEGIKVSTVNKKFFNEYYIKISESETQYTYNKDLNSRSNYPFIEDKENSLNSEIVNSFNNYYS